MARRSKISPSPTNVVEMAGAGDFRRLFSQSSVRHNFNLTLTGPMLETLCAIADGCVRDREFHWTYSSVTPGNFVTSCEPLIKRGLVYHEPVELVRDGDTILWDKFHENYKNGRAPTTSSHRSEKRSSRC